LEHLLGWKMASGQSQQEEAHQGVPTALNLHWLNFLQAEA